MLKPLKVKIKPEWMETLRSTVTKFDNDHIYGQPNRRLGKVFNVDQYYERLNMVRLKSTQGEYLSGQYDLNIFSIMTRRKTKNILEMAKSWHYELGMDRHSTGTYYCVVNQETVPNLKFLDLVRSVIPDDETMPEFDGEKHDMSFADDYADDCYAEDILWSDSKYCFVDFRNWVGDKRSKIVKDYTHLIGFFMPCVSIEDALKWCEAARDCGWLPKGTRFEERNGGIEYALPLTKPFNIDRVYFSLSCLRMIREFAVTVTVTLRLMDTFKLPFDVAAILAYNTAGNSYSLHMAWPRGYRSVLTASAIKKFLARTGIRYGSEYDATYLVEELIQGKEYLTANREQGTLLAKDLFKEIKQA
jgi:hypothetical protein